MTLNSIIYTQVPLRHCRSTRIKRELNLHKLIIHYLKKNGESDSINSENFTAFCCAKQINQQLNIPIKRFKNHNFINNKIIK